MTEDAPEKPSAMGTILGVVIATLLAVVFGGGGGIYMSQLFDTAENVTTAQNPAGPVKKGKISAGNERQDKAPSKKEASGAKEDNAKEGQTEDAEPIGQRVTLAPITTNLLSPKGTWIRLEASVMSARSLPDNHTELIAQIQEDLLGFLRTLKLSQIQGPSGFQHMREDLNDRVRIRSEGAFNKLLIHALLVE